MKKLLYWGLGVTGLGVVIIVLGAFLSGIISSTFCFCGVAITLSGLQCLSISLKSYVLKNNNTSKQPPTQVEVLEYKKQPTNNPTINKDKSEYSKNSAKQHSQNKDLENSM